MLARLWPFQLVLSMLHLVQSTVFRSTHSSSPAVSYPSLILLHIKSDCSGKVMPKDGSKHSRRRYVELEWELLAMWRSLISR